MARALMIQGTASHAGKSLLTAAFGCWLREQGRRVAPFKAQNMSNNSYVTLQGEEVARSQAAQAEALGLEPAADMNPVLLKPMSQGCQVVVQGHGVGIMSIHEYYAYKPTAWHAITESYDRLAEQYDWIVLEGAGSPAEVNLKDNDLVNMRMAHHADAAVVLVADIERGGVFAQLIGTWELLEPAERERVIGFVINKFRGEASLLKTGLEMVETRTGRPVFGVLPFDESIQLDEEDTLGVPLSASFDEINIAVVCLPGLSNFTDFAALARAPHTSLQYVTRPEALSHADLLILPGTRTTVRALGWLSKTGLADRIKQLVSEPGGPLVLGICGGCQILGHAITDPQQIESEETQVQGLGLLDIDTVFEPGKTLCRVTAEVAAGPLCPGQTIIGYEVHQGHSTRREGTPAWLKLRRQQPLSLPPSHGGKNDIPDGAVSACGRVFGTYVHGLFDDVRLTRALVDFLRRRQGLPVLADEDWLCQRSSAADRYERLLKWLEDHCDMEKIATAIELKVPR